MLVTVGMQISSFRRESGVGNSLPARAEAFYLSDVSSGKGPNLAMRNGGVLRSWEGHVEGPMALDGIALVMGIGLIVLGLVLPFQPNLRRSVRVFTCWTGFNVALASAIEIFKSESLMYGISYSVTDTISWILTGVETVSVLAALFYALSFTPAITSTMHVPPWLYRWLYGRRMTDEP